MGGISPWLDHGGRNIGGRLVHHNLYTPLCEAIVEEVQVVLCPFIYRDYFHFTYHHQWPKVPCGHH